jgi:hypothetical protein
MENIFDYEEWGGIRVLDFFFNYFNKQGFGNLLICCTCCSFMVLNNVKAEWVKWKKVTKS